MNIKSSVSPDIPVSAITLSQYGVKKVLCRLKVFLFSPVFDHLEHTFLSTPVYFNVFISHMCVSICKYILIYSLYQGVDVCPGFGEVYRSFCRLGLLTRGSKCVPFVVIEKIPVTS